MWFTYRNQMSFPAQPSPDLTCHCKSLSKLALPILVLSSHAQYWPTFCRPAQSFPALPGSVWCFVPFCLALSCPTLLVARPWPAFLKPARSRSTLSILPWSNQHGSILLTAVLFAWPCTAWHCPFRPCPVLLTVPGLVESCPTLTDPSWPRPVLFGAVRHCPAFPDRARTCPTLPGPAQPCPVSTPVRDCLVLSGLSRPV